MLRKFRNRCNEIVLHPRLISSLRNAPIRTIYSVALLLVSSAFFNACFRTNCGVLAVLNVTSGILFNEDANIHSKQYTDHNIVSSSGDTQNLEAETKDAAESRRKALEMQQYLFQHGILFNVAHTMQPGQPPKATSSSTTIRHAMPLDSSSLSGMARTLRNLTDSISSSYISIANISDSHEGCDSTETNCTRSMNNISSGSNITSLDDRNSAREYEEDGMERQKLEAKISGIVNSASSFQLSRQNATSGTTSTGITAASEKMSFNKHQNNNRRRRLQLTGFGQGLLSPSLGSGPSMASINATKYRWQSITPGSTVDWRTTPYITPITPQYTCQSCWAMAAVDAVTIMWAIMKKSPPLPLSPQEICDCASKQCCKGGWPEWAFAYILFNGGVSASNDYPYSAVDRTTCLLGSDSLLAPPKGAMITGWEQVPARSSLALMQAVTMQPVVVFINADSPDFQTYSSRGYVNVYNGLCTKDITHTVLLVGYNIANTALGPYWIVKNSWAKSWGDSGFMYIAMKDGDGTCGMNIIPGLYPTYYPQGPQQVPISSGMVKYSNFGYSALQAQWWSRWSWDLLSYPNACAGIINPCGAGICWSSFGIARCNCVFFPFKHVELRGVPTSKCVLSNPCEANPYSNPCGAGTCQSPSDGTYSCTCPAGYAVGVNIDGETTCVIANLSPATRTYTTTYGETCSSIETAFGISDSAFRASNPFVDCSFTLPPGIVVSVGTSMATACTQSYTVKLFDSCISISLLVAGGLSALQALNPTLMCPFPYPGQQLCIKAAAVSGTTPDPTLLCGQIYTTVAGDTCAKIQTTFGISSATFAKLNPNLVCTVTQLLSVVNVLFTAGIQICVKAKSNVPAIICSKSYTIVQGDNCATIWNAANMSSTAFFAINQGLKCSSLQVGTSVCIDSPSLATSDPSITPILYVIQTGDTFNSISNAFGTRCYPSSITPSIIASYNRLDPYSPPSPGMTLLIPCNKRVGYIDCGCAPSIPVCGTDFMTYPSYCDAMCNYAIPTTLGACGACQGNCSARVGIAPKVSSISCPSICPYPSWQPDPNDVSLVVGSQPGRVCTYVASTCDNVCQAVKVTLGGSASTQLANQNACISQCMCCSRIPCAGSSCPAPYSTCQAYPERCTCSGTTCKWSCTWWNAYFGVTASTVP